ncbi:MAG: MFS transporter, partial [Pirellulales bacterium]
ATTPAARVSDIFQPGVLYKTIMGTCLAGMALIGTWGSIQWIQPWANKMAAGSEAANTAAASAQICAGIGAIIGTLSAALLAEWFSRRWCYFALSLASFAVCQFLFRAPMEYGGWFLLWVGLAGGVTASFYGWLPLYLPELFPTRIRATAQGFSFNFGRVLAAVGVLQSGQLLNFFREDYAQMCSIISLVYLAGMVLIWFCPETKGKPLPD